MLVFQKNRHALISSYTRFEIRLFTLLTTNWVKFQ